MHPSELSRVDLPLTSRSYQLKHQEALLLIRFRILIYTTKVVVSDLQRRRAGSLSLCPTSDVESLVHQKERLALI
jgi:hypothetical protein